MTVNDNKYLNKKYCSLCNIKLIEFLNMNVISNQSFETNSVKKALTNSGEGLLPEGVPLKSRLAIIVRSLLQDFKIR